MHTSVSHLRVIFHLKTGPGKMIENLYFQENTLKVNIFGLVLEY